jgi:hypothetical protein
MAMFQRRLGKAPVKTDIRTLQLEYYLDADKLPIVPGVIDWGATQPKSWGAMLNDEIGDCVLAAQGHLVQLWTHNRPDGKMVTIPDSAVLQAYHDVGGYVPGQPSTDQGANMLDALKYWRKTGIGGHKIAAFVQVNPRHEAMVRAALWLFGGLYAGYSLPESASTQDLWDVSPEGILTGEYAPGSWGGHAVCHLSQDRSESRCITWGYVQPMTERFVRTYCDELYAVLSEDWFTAGKSVAGFDLSALTADLGIVTK